MTTPKMGERKTQACHKHSGEQHVHEFNGTKWVCIQKKVDAQAQPVKKEA